VTNNLLTIAIDEARKADILIHTRERINCSGNIGYGGENDRSTQEKEDAKQIWI